MYKNIVHKIRHVGFMDVGGCNLAVATAELCGQGVIPQRLILNKKNSSATESKAVPGIFTGGYLKKPNGEILVGEDITGDNFDIYNFCSEFVVNFKTKPSENEKPLTEFLKAWNKLLRENWKEYRDDPEATIWFVSYPNGWESEKDRYRDIFIKAGFEHVCMVPESNAAMLHNLRLDESDEVALKVDRKLLTEALKICKIIVDSGSYSNDTVCIDKNGFTDSVYSYTGAHIIEMMIVCANLRFSLEKFGIKDDVIQSTQRGIVRKVFEDDSELAKKLRSFLFTHARLMKEEIFQALTNTPSPEPVSKIVYLGEYFTKTYGISTYTLHVSLQMIDDLLQEYSVKEILGDKIFATLSKESQKEIGSKTWSTCYKDYSQKIVDSFPGFKAALKDESKTPLVIFTGGASGMPVVTNTLLNTFDYVSEYGYEVRKDKEPLFSILNGLAVYAEGQLRAWAVEQACEGLLSLSVTDMSDEELQIISDDFKFEIKIHEGMTFMEWLAEGPYKVLAVFVAHYIQEECDSRLKKAKRYWLDSVRVKALDGCEYKIYSPADIVCSDKYEPGQINAKWLITYMFDKLFEKELKSMVCEVMEEYWFPLFKDLLDECVLDYPVFAESEFRESAINCSDTFIEQICGKLMSVKEELKDMTLENILYIDRFFKDFEKNRPGLCTNRGAWKKALHRYAVYDDDGYHQRTPEEEFEVRCAILAEKIFEDIEEMLDGEIKHKIIADFINAFKSELNRFRTEQDWISLVQADSLT